MFPLQSREIPSEWSENLRLTRLVKKTKNERKILHFLCYKLTKLRIAYEMLRKGEE